MGNVDLQTSFQMSPITKLRGQHCNFRIFFKIHHYRDQKWRPPAVSAGNIRCYDLPSHLAGSEITTIALSDMSGSTATASAVAASNFIHSGHLNETSREESGAARGKMTRNRFP